MKNKIFSLFAASLILMALFVSGVNALTLSSVQNSNVLQNNSGQVTVSGDESFNATTTFPQTFKITSGTNTATFSVNNASSLNNTQSALFKINLTDVVGNFPINSYSGSFNISAVTLTGTAASNNPFSVPVNFISSFCKNGDVNSSDLSLDVRIKNDGTGTDTDWDPLDTLRVQVKLTNGAGSSDGDLSDVTLELGLYKQGTNTNIASDMIWISSDDEQYDYGSLDHGDNTGWYDFEFKVDPSSIDLGSNSNYYLVVKAYDNNENKVCIDNSDALDSNYYQRISISSPSSNKAVVVDESAFPNLIQTSCGQQVTLNPNVWNLGTKDYNDKVLVTLTNTELGVNMNSTYNNDLNSGDEAQVPFTFSIPQNATEKTYTLSMRTYYDYDLGKGTYFNDYKKISDKVFTANLNVAGNCVVIGKASVSSAEITSGGKAGEPLSIKLTVTNSGNSKADYTINPKDYASWASSATASPTVLTLSPGESKDVILTLNVNPNAQGAQNFNVEIASGNQVVATQPVSATIESAGFLAGLTGNAVLGNNAAVWGFLVVNLILVVAIIFVVVRMIRRS